MAKQFINVANVPCFDVIPSKIVCKYLILPLSAHSADVVSPWGNNRAANSRPYADVPHRTRCVICGSVTIIEFVGVVLRAANQNPMIAGGDHSIIQRLSAARQRGKFLSRTVTHPPGPHCCEYSLFRRCITEFHLQMFGIALSALCADVVSPLGKQPGG